MKRALFFICIISLLTIGACKKDDGPTAQERVSALLLSAKAWQDPVVTVDGVDYTDLYKDFTITFSKGAYTTTSGTPVWVASGTWKFIDEEATLIKMDNNRDVEINSITNDLLELSFQWHENTFEPGRSSSVKGKQRFRLKRRP